MLGSVPIRCGLHSPKLFTSHVTVGHRLHVNILSLAIFLGLVGDPTYAGDMHQSMPCDDTDISNYIVRSIRISGLSLSEDQAKQLNSTGGVGSKADYANAREARILADRFIERGVPRRNFYDPQLRHVTLKLTCFPHTNPPQVDIVYNPYLINIVTSPHQRYSIPAVTILLPSGVINSSPIDNLPFQIDNDRLYGLSTEFDTGLLTLAQSGETIIAADIFAKKSLSKTYANYSAKFLVVADLIFSPGALVGPQHPEYSFSGTYANDYAPLGDGTLWKESGKAAYSVGGRLASTLKSIYVVGGSTDTYRSSYALDDQPTTADSIFKTSAYGLIAVDTGNGSLSASAIGIYGNSSDKSSFTKAVASLNYSGNIDILHSPIQVDLLGAIGSSTGSLPESESYFLGYKPIVVGPSPVLNGLANFNVPTQPVLRSAGSNQFGLINSDGNQQGATSFWNTSLSVAVPIGLSKLLIPNAEVCLNKPTPPKPCKEISKSTLHEVLRNQVSTQYGMVRANYMKVKGVSRPQADVILRPLWRDRIIPTTNDILATNLYSVRPLLLFDSAGLQLGSSSDTYIGVGGGIQADLINASLQLGYMQTVAPSQYSGTGNFFLRFAIRRLGFP